jgi:hypothetical protein
MSGPMSTLGTVKPAVKRMSTTQLHLAHIESEVFSRNPRNATRLASAAPVREPEHVQTATAAFQIDKPPKSQIPHCKSQAPIKNFLESVRAAPHPQAL